MAPGRPGVSAPGQRHGWCCGVRVPERVSRVSQRVPQENQCFVPFFVGERVSVYVRLVGGVKGCFSFLDRCMSAQV